MATRSVVCVLKKSDTYDMDYVERLWDGVRKQGDYNFVIVRESPWPGWWAKMSLFNPELGGDFLYFDLDTVIVGPIDDLFTGKVTTLSDWNRLQDIASGVMYLPEADRREVWSEWIKNPEAHMEKRNGDGGFINRFYQHTALRYNDILPGKIVSYKIHCKQDAPQDASVICYHGNPRPRDTGWATGGSEEAVRRGRSSRR